MGIGRAGKRGRVAVPLNFLSFFFFSSSSSCSSSSWGYISEGGRKFFLEFFLLGWGTCESIHLSLELVYWPAKLQLVLCQPCTTGTTLNGSPFHPREWRKRSNQSWYSAGRWIDGMCSSFMVDRCKVRMGWMDGWMYVMMCVVIPSSSTWNTWE